MDTLLADLRYGARSLVKRPGFALVAILTMALGIGANAAIFSVVNALMLKAPAYAEPDRVVELFVTSPNIVRESSSLPDFVDWRDRNTVFSSMAAASVGSVNVTGEGDPERVIASRVTPNFLATLGVAPAAGRDFSPEEGRPNAGRVAVVSDAFWKRRFGGAADAVGRDLEINGERYAVVGVLPASFTYPEPTRVDVLVPLTKDPSAAGRRSDFLEVYARLEPDVTVARAADEMRSIAARLGEEYPDTNEGVSVATIPLAELRVEASRPALYVLLGAVAFVLLIACANVANLLLARASSRHREIAIRAALGAGRWRIARQVITESVLLSVLGGGAGLLAAPWAIDVLVRAVPGDAVRFAEVGVDARVVGFALALATLTGLVFGLAPALQVSRVGAGEALKDGGRGTAGEARRGTRGALVAAQIGLALVLLVGVGLMLRSFERLNGVDLGFDARGVVTARVNLPPARYDDDAKVVAFYSGLRERVAAIPGVTSAGAINALPILGGGPFLTFEEANAPEPPPGSAHDANVRVVDPGYLATMRIPVLAGRGLAETDGVDAPNAVVVNETMARRYWPGESPIGRRIAFEGTDSGPNWREVVGVVGDVRHEGVEEPEDPAAYVPYAQRPVGSLAVVARVEGDPTAAANAIRAAVRELDPSLPVYNVQTLDAALADSLAPRRYTLLLLGLFGLVALSLAAVGIYGVMSYLVANRTQEIGVRMALGAERGDVLGLVLRQGMGMAALGLGGGALGALAVTRLAASQLYEVSPTDPLTFACAAGVLAAVAALACLVPARRATKVDPLVALHND